MEKYHKAIKVFNIVGAFIIIILLLLLIFPSNPISKSIETSRLGYDKEVCWNKSEDGKYWNNGCSGQKVPSGNPQLPCQLVLGFSLLSEIEKSQYSNWVKAGKPIAKGCE